MKLSRLSVHRKVANLFGRLDTEDKAWSYYDWQKATLQALKIQEWFKYILEYREAEADEAMRNLTNKSTKGDDVVYRQAKHNQAMQFLDFIENIGS